MLEEAIVALRRIWTDGPVTHEGRFWRFGQTCPVDAHMIASELEGNVVQNLRRKEADADRMAAAMVRHMKDLSTKAVRGMLRDTPNYQPKIKMELPTWA